ncbi:MULTISPECIES: hypothetical protein [unclassified Streptomyces]|uniref:hypothetical protein n=1 Tax=Streptomyces sp. NPDC055082 TaxID=3365718 RepID=UPI0037D80FA5
MTAEPLPAGLRTAYAVDAVPAVTLFPEEEQPVAGAWLGPANAVVVIAPDTATFRVRPGPELDAPARKLLGAPRGRWLVQDGPALTAAGHPPVNRTGGGQPWCYLPPRSAARM